MEEDNHNRLPTSILFFNARVSSSLSILSSILIIVAIHRSQLRLTRIYNRIMLGISTMDIISSIPITFTTLPMPAADTVTTLPGAAGNIVTCNLQGYFSNFGYMGSMLYSVGLTLYYLCTIHYRMSDDKFQRVYEKLIHVLCVLVPCSINVCGLNHLISTSLIIHVF